MAKRPQPYHRENLEEELLTQAAEIVASRGIDALSFRELGRRANVSHSAPYHYFSDKAALIFKMGELGFRRLGLRIAQEVAGQTQLQQKFRAGLHGYVGFALEDAHFFRLMFANVLRRDTAFNSGKDAPMLAFSSPAAQETFAILLDGVRELQTAGILKPGDPLLLLNVFWAYTHGVAVLALDNHLKQHDATSVLNAGLDALLSGSGPTER